MKKILMMTFSSILALALNILNIEASPVHPDLSQGKNQEQRKQAPKAGEISGTSKTVRQLTQQFEDQAQKAATLQKQEDENRNKLTLYRLRAASNLLREIHEQCEQKRLNALTKLENLKKSDSIENTAYQGILKILGTMEQSYDENKKKFLDPKEPLEATARSIITECRSALKSVGVLFGKEEKRTK